MHRKMYRREFLSSLLLLTFALKSKAQEGDIGMNSAARETWNNLSEEEKNSLREKWKKFQSLPADKKEKIKEGLNRFKKMSPEQRALIKEKLKKWQSLTPEQRQKITARFKAIRKMDPAKRKHLERRIEMWNRMSPEQKNKLRERVRRRRRI